MSILGPLGLPNMTDITQGTGITSILLYNLPYNAGWLQRLGIVIFVLNVLIFALLCVGHIARYIRFKGLFTASINHLMSGMFWGTLPMGLITIVVSSTIRRDRTDLATTLTMTEHGRVCVCTLGMGLGAIHPWFMVD